MGKADCAGHRTTEIEQWLKAVKREEGLENPTLDKTRRVMRDAAPELRLLIEFAGVAFLLRPKRRTR